MPGGAGRWASAADWASERLDLRRWLVLAGSRVRQGWRRVRGSVVPVVQAALGGALAWQIAFSLLDHPAPVFAPVATWICLGFTKDRVPRKVAELGAGAVLGVLIGEVFALVLTPGWWQIALVLVVAALFARLLDRGDLFTMQSGVNGVVILGMASLGQGAAAAGRWSDAVVGALVAFVVAVLLPRRVTERPRRYARATLAELAVAFEMAAHGLRSGDVQVLRDASAQLRGTRQIHLDWARTLATATDVVRLNPALRADRPVVDELARLHRLTERTMDTLDALVRHGIGIVSEVGAVARLGPLVADLGRSAHALAGSVGGWHRPERARELASAVAAELDPEALGTDWRSASLAVTARALAVDLLQSTGLSRADARARLPGAPGNPYLDDAAGPDEGASDTWGTAD